jgi:hypothetical protein
LNTLREISDIPVIDIHYIKTNKINNL